MLFPFPTIWQFLHFYVTLHKEELTFLLRLIDVILNAADLENMTSAERIAILQEKLQEIRKHYLSLKSEVASIDRRRKRLKKKERESEYLCLTFSFIF